MCFHHRLVFSCGHYIWLPYIARPCEAEKAFTRGEATIGCSKMWSSGFCTMKVSQKCEVCSSKEAESTAQIADIRRRIGALKELVDKITSSPKSKDKSPLQAGEKEMTDDERKNELLEMVVAFDDEYEARLEDFSPISSPVAAGPGSKIFSEPEIGATSSSDRKDRGSAHSIPDEDPQHRPLLLASVLRRTKTTPSSAQPTR